MWVTMMIDVGLGVTNTDLPFLSYYVVTQPLCSLFLPHPFLGHTDWLDSLKADKARVKSPGPCD